MSDDDETKPTATDGKATEVCPQRLKKNALWSQEFQHAAKRLAREKVTPLLQLAIVAYNCTDASHPPVAPGEAYFHIDDVAFYNDPLMDQLPNGRAAVILAVEQMLARLKVGFH